ncbi:unnamed protein product [Moneuplotes crassus]|uniref:Uncharacterized protein n=1 Tax=Euplotes crassus TaxID=5936 RepID=A0AAD1UH48_EUPCR|nr:unnamed protein product [Moneuplotes crassus]
MIEDQPRELAERQREHQRHSAMMQQQLRDEEEDYGEGEYVQEEDVQEEGQVEEEEEYEQRDAQDSQRLILEGDNYNRAREREEVLKKLVSSQEVYIQELEGKKGELEGEIHFWRNNKSQESATQERSHQDKVAQSSGDQDSSILVDLVEKNQIMIQHLQDQLKEKEEDYENRLNQSEIHHRTELEVLESENRILKKAQEQKFTCEKDRVNFHSTLRNNLLEEIERIEKDQEEKEKNLSQWRSNMMTEFQEEREDAENRIQNLSQQIQELSAQLADKEKEHASMQSEFEARVDYLTSQKRALEQKVEERSRQIGTLQNSLSSKHHQSTSDETKWETEKEELYKNLSQVSEILEDKERLHEEQLKNLEEQYKISLEVLDQRIKMLNDEKRQVEKQRGFEKDDLSISLAETSTQVEKLRATNGLMISIFTERENQAASDIELMRNEVVNLQKLFDNREVNYIDETRKYAENVERLHSLLEKANERLEQGWDPEKIVSEELRIQVETLERQLAVKDEQLENLKVEVLDAQNQQRKDITETIGKFRAYLQHMGQQEVLTEQKYQDFLAEQQEVDKICNERELDDTNKINDSLGEINDLRFRIRELEANNKAKEYAELESRFIKLEAELSYTKQSLVGKIQTLNTFEDQIRHKLEQSDVNLDENDEILRLRMENVRLNEENSSLLNAKQSIETNLNDRIDVLVKKLFIKTEECEELQNKYSNLLTSLNGQREEEIKSWIRRQDLVKKTIEELRIQLKDTRDRRTSSLAMKDQEHKLTTDEVKLLRIEASKMQKSTDKMFNDWVNEKNGLHLEINSLRDNLKAVETYYHEAKDLKNQESDLIAEQRHKLREKEEYYIQLANQKIEIESAMKEQREREDADREEKTERIINMLRKELSDAHGEIKKLQNYHNSKIEEIEQLHEEKIKIINEKEGSSQYHNQQLKSRLENAEKTYNDLKTNEKIEKIVLRTQVKTLSKLTEERIEKTLLEKEDIKSKLDSLVKSAAIIEDEENRYKSTIELKLSKIQKFMKKVHEVLASTYKSEELELILRDLEDIAQRSGLEDKTKSSGYSKKRMDYEDRISERMHHAKKEIEKIHSLEGERKAKHMVEKLSIVELSHRLASLIKDIEEITAYEKKIMTGEIKQFKEAMGEKENRLNNEVKGIKRERDDLLVKLGTLDLNNREDQQRLETIINGYKEDKDERVTDVMKENEKLHSYATKVTELLESSSTKVPVTLPSKGRYKADLKATGKPQKSKKASYLTSSKKAAREVNIRNSVRKKAQK